MGIAAYSLLWVMQDFNHHPIANLSLALATAAAGPPWAAATDTLVKFQCW